MQERGGALEYSPQAAPPRNILLPLSHAAAVSHLPLSPSAPELPVSFPLLDRSDGLLLSVPLPPLHHTRVSFTPQPLAEWVYQGVMKGRRSLFRQVDSVRNAVISATQLDRGEHRAHDRHAASYENPLFGIQ